MMITSHIAYIFISFSSYAFAFYFLVQWKSKQKLDALARFDAFHGKKKKRFFFLYFIIFALEKHSKHAKSSELIKTMACMVDAIEKIV